MIAVMRGDYVISQMGQEEEVVVAGGRRIQGSQHLTSGWQEAAKGACFVCLPAMFAILCENSSGHYPAGLVGGGSDRWWDKDKDTQGYCD